MPYLNEYARKELGTRVMPSGEMQQIIEVKVNEASIGYHEIHISDLLAGMGYNISNDGKKIYIQ